MDIYQGAAKNYQRVAWIKWIYVMTRYAKMHVPVVVGCVPVAFPASMLQSCCSRNWPTLPIHNAHHSFPKKKKIRVGDEKKARFLSLRLRWIPVFYAFPNQLRLQLRIIKFSVVLYIFFYRINVSYVVMCIFTKNVRFFGPHPPTVLSPKKTISFDTFPYCLADWPTLSIGTKR